MIEACKAHYKQGSNVRNYTKGIRKFGLKFSRIKFNYDQIHASLKNGRPIVICYQVNKDESHFSTIIGARKDERNLAIYTLNDTYYGKYEIPEEVLKYLMKLDESWARAVEKM